AFDFDEPKQFGSPATDLALSRIGGRTVSHEDARRARERCERRKCPASATDSTWKKLLARPCLPYAPKRTYRSKSARAARSGIRPRHETVAPPPSARCPDRASGR